MVSRSGCVEHATYAEYFCAISVCRRAWMRSLAAAGHAMRTVAKSLPRPVRLDIADDPASWTSAGFRVGPDSTVDLGEVAIRLTGRGDSSGGVVGWAFASLPDGVRAIDGLPTEAVAATQLAGDLAATPAPHPNGACSVDTIVYLSDDWQRSVDALRAIGLEPKRQTSVVRRGVTQVIYRPGQAIIELVGPRQPPPKPSLAGLTLVTADVDATHAALSESTKPPWDAVQPGRRMTVVKHALHGMSVPIAFISPHVRGVERSGDERERLLERRARAQEAELKRRGEDTGGASKL